jgi:hypothetical protein
MCGMKYPSREVAFGKMQAMVKGAEIMSREFASPAPNDVGRILELRIGNSAESWLFWQQHTAN